MGSRNLILNLFLGDPLTPTRKTWGPLPAPADENAAAGHPLPQGGEGSKFKSMSLRSPRRQKGRRRGQKNQINSPLAPLGERDRG